MSLGPLMIGVRGVALTGEERRRLRHPAAGGVCLFTRNFESVAQLSELCSDIHALRTPPLLIAVDQEGGRVQRFRGEFTELPPPAVLAPVFERDREEGERAARALAWTMAAELRAVGVDFSFAPVVDLDNGISGVIGDRAFHRDPASVYRLARAWMNGSAAAGMASVAKHFPGHGGCAADSHFEIPVDERSWPDLEANDLVPFRRLIDSGLEGVMTAHVLYPAVDQRALASFSRDWVEGVLRRRLGFQGAVFSDDLGMAAAHGEGELATRVRRTIGAGCDVALVCNEDAAVDPVLERLDPPRPASAMRLARLHGRASDRRWPSLRASQEWRDAKAIIDRLHEGLSGELDV